MSTSSGEFIHLGVLLPFLVCGVAYITLVLNNTERRWSPSGKTQFLISSNSVVIDCSFITIVSDVHVSCGAKSTHNDIFVVDDI